MGKRFWFSRTFWVNATSLAAILVQMKTGFVIEPEDQFTLLALVNLVLRFVTREPLMWNGESGQ